MIDQRRAGAWRHLFEHPQPITLTRLMMDVRKQKPFEGSSTIGPGVFGHPLWFSRDISKTAAQSDAVSGTTVDASFPHMLSKTPLLEEHHSKHSRTSSYRLTWHPDPEKFDLTSNFQNDLLRSTYSSFDASWQEKHNSSEMNGASESLRGKILLKPESQ